MLLAAITTTLVAGLEPPARYVHEPRAEYTISYLPQARVQKICARAAHKATDLVLGCSLPELGFIYVARELRWDVKAVILRHEKAHLNGWRHGDHSVVTAAKLRRFKAK